MKMKKGRFNIFDILLILVVCGAVAFGIWYFLPDSTENIQQVLEETVSIEYRVKYTKVSDNYHFGDIVHEGDKVYETGTKNCIGTIITVEEPTLSPYYGLNTLTGEAAEPDYYRDYHDWYVVVKADAKLDEGCYAVEGTTIAVGTKFGMRTDFFTGECQILSMTVEDTAAQAQETLTEAVAD